MANVTVITVSIIIVLVAIVGSKQIPAYFKVCKRANPSQGDCALKNANIAIPYLIKGDREYKFPPLEPLKISKLGLDNGPSLRLSLTDITVSGLSSLKVTTLDIDTVKRKIHLALESPLITFVSDYVISGRILVLPITGSGPAKVVLIDTRIDEYITYDLINEKGKEHMKLTDLTSDMFTRNATFRLDNLFNGNKELGDNMNRILNENPQESSKELIYPVTKEIIKSVTSQILFNLFSQVPYDDIFSD